jgi:Xaa-Pro aminopeptidase
MNLHFEDLKKVMEILATYEKKIDKNFKIPLHEYEERYKKVWAELEKKEIDLGFFFWYREMPGDGIYLTGYNPNIERASGVISPNKRPLILAGPESGILAKEVGLNLETHFVNEFSIPDEYYEGVERGSLKTIISDYASDIKRVGFMTHEDYIPAKFMNFLKESLGAKELVDATSILEDLRYEKSENEFKCMEQADIIANAAVRCMLAISKPGMLETEIAAVGDFAVKTLGGTGYGFETIVNSADRCRTVIGPASNRMIKEGEIVQIGISPSFEGYKGVCRRAFVMGERNSLQNEYFRVMNEGFRRAEKAIYEVAEQNLPSNTIDLAARDYFNTMSIEGTNMKSTHFYSTCHGTGLTECLEPMVITPTKTERYGKNVGIMLDLGCYGHPNVEICGGCVENAYLKRGNAVQCCTDIPVDVQELVGKGI